MAKGVIFLSGFTACLMTVLSIFGIIEIFRRILFFSFKLNDQKKFSVVIEIETPDECEYMIRAAAEKMEWLELSESKLICINKSKSEEVDLICRKLSSKYRNLVLLNSDDM